MGEKGKKNEEKKEENATIIVVLKVDMHCEGCTKKVKRSVKSLKGVEEVHGDAATNKLTVKGKVDPMKLRERIERKTKKKAELISPILKKDRQESADKKTQVTKKEEKSKKKDEKKNKEPPVSTVVLKIWLHCEGCVQKTRNIISKIKGVQSVVIDTQEDLVTVKGTMDVKALLSYVKGKLHVNVEAVVVLPEKKSDNRLEKKERYREQGYNGGQGGNYIGQGHYLGEGYGCGYGYVVEYVPAPQFFSDENPNACVVM